MIWIVQQTVEIRRRPSRVIENCRCYVVRRRLSLNSSFVLNVKKKLFYLKEITVYFRIRQACVFGTSLETFYDLCQL